MANDKKNFSNENFRTSYRIGSKHSFLRIAINSYFKYSENVENWKKYRALINPVANSDYSENMKLFYKYQDEATDTYKIMITFLCTFLESYIYELACVDFGDGFAKQNFSNMSTLQKWTIIPLLVTGKKIDISHHYYEVISKMIKKRNDIIHFKSKAWTENMKIEDIDKLQIIDLDIDPIRYFDAIETLFTQLDEIDHRGRHVAVMGNDWRRLRNFRPLPQKEVK